jgi:hypothetical protein
MNLRQLFSQTSGSNVDPTERCGGSLLSASVAVNLASLYKGSFNVAFAIVNGQLSLLQLLW